MKFGKKTNLQLVHQFRSLKLKYVSTLKEKVQRYELKSNPNK